MPLEHSPKKPTNDAANDVVNFRLQQNASNDHQTGIAADTATMTTIKSLSRQRHHVLNKVFRIKESLDRQLGLSDLEVLFCNLQSAYAEFAGFHSQIVAVIPDEAMEQEEETYVRFEALYNFTFAGVKKRIMNQHAQPAPQVVIHQQPLKAPIPTFDGDYANWPKFKAVFQDVIALSRDSDAIKLYHLDKALVGAAAGVLDTKTLNEGNYAQAWRILSDRYENQRMIVETHIRGLLSLKKMTSQSSKELQRLVDDCTKHVESLEYQKQPLLGVSELVVVYLLTSALDDSTRLQWEQSMASSTDLPKYDETVNFLQSQCKVLERWEAARSTTTIETNFEPKQSSTESKLPSQQVFATTTESQEPKDKCDFCRGFHLNYQCNKLNALSANDRMEKVKAAGICFNCLRKGHQVKNCPSPKSCRKCQSRHHTQLHDDDANVTPASTSTAASTIPDDNLEQAHESVSSTSNPIPTSEQPVPTSCSCQNPVIENRFVAHCGYFGER
ncbi:uncharacterized protein LOC134288310 [Aedes albopictus]|uniref:CCHC-type domain-containing protein n=1 Tax=Aedes albopictus TaxID=7160 RepID=A0ABM1YT85_AEDAL